MQIVKRARFHAAERLESKHNAGQLAFAIAGIYGFLIPIFILQFKANLTPFTASIIDFVAVVSGALSFTIAMLYQERDYKGRARRLHACALEINQLLQQLSVSRINRETDLQGFVQHYGAILSRYENHEHIDYQIAIARDSRAAAASSDEDDRGETMRWLLVRRFLITHGLTVAVWLVPPAIGLVAWLALAGAQ